MLNRNLEESYTPGAAITVDEQLFPIRGRTRFTQYIPSKPAKYGIKVWWVCDSNTNYPLRGQIYTGKLPNAAREEKQGVLVVLDLVDKYRNSGRTVYCDTFHVTQLGRYASHVQSTINFNVKPGSLATFARIQCA